MAEMTNEEAREIIGNLLDSIETGFVLAAAQKAVTYRSGWEGLGISGCGCAGDLPEGVS